MSANTTEAILMFAIVALLALMGWDQRRKNQQRKRQEDKEITRSLWRMVATKWVREQADEGNILLCIIADKEAQGQELNLVEFSCTRCTLRFWTETGRQLVPACCPHCGMQFTHITKAPDLCTAN